MASGRTKSGNGAAAEAGSADEQMRGIYAQQESRSAKAFEQLVNMPAFGAVLARSAENMAAMSRIGTELADMVLRNLRVAGRSDITRLARQLHRTEDKLERVLQEVEALRDEVARPRTSRSGGRTSARGSSRKQGKRASGSS